MVLTWFGWRPVAGVWRWCRTTRYGGVAAGAGGGDPVMRTAVAAAEPEPRPLVSPVLLTTGTTTTVGDPGLLISTTATATAHTWTATCAGHHGITEPCRGG